jgi:hypothetical protein
VQHSATQAHNAAPTPAPWLGRHHYQQDLEGCPAAAVDVVQAAHVRLYSSLGEVLIEAVGKSDQPLGSGVMWAWAIDALPKDHEFLLRVGIVDALAKITSLQTKAIEEWSGESEAATTWTPWSAPETRSRALTGRLTKHEILAHISAAPAPPSSVGGLTGAAWLASRGVSITGSAPTALSMSQVLSLQSAFTLDWLGLSGASVDAADSAVTATMYDTAVPTDEDATLVAVASAQSVARPVLTRKSTLHSRHSHPLTFTQRSERCSCNVCHRDLGATGSTSAWYCSPDDFDCCEACFAKRSVSAVLLFVLAVLICVQPTGMLTATLLFAGF